MEHQPLTFDTQHALGGGVKPRRRSKKPPLLLMWHVHVGILSALLFRQPLLLSCAHIPFILMGKHCLQFHDQSDARGNQGLLKSHYLVISSTGKCLGRTQSALKRRVMMTFFQHCNEGFYSEGYFLFLSLCINLKKKKIPSLLNYVCLWN